MAVLVKHHKASFDYEILERFEAGLVLEGFEAKALRSGRGSLEGSHIITRGNEAFVVGLQIPPYQPANTPDEYDPARIRKILLSKEEISKLSGAASGRGQTIIPISIYPKGRFLKMEIAIARGKKKYDKRQTIKKRDQDRTIRREYGL